MVPSRPQSRRSRSVPRWAAGSRGRVSTPGPRTPWRWQAVFSGCFADSGAIWSGAFLGRLAKPVNALGTTGSTTGPGRAGGADGRLIGLFGIIFNTLVGDHTAVGMAAPRRPQIAFQTPPCHFLPFWLFFAYLRPSSVTGEGPVEGPGPLKKKAKNAFYKPGPLRYLGSIGLCH